MAGPLGPANARPCTIDRCRNKAKLLKRLAAAGARDFYEGETAHCWSKDLRAGGSRIEAADLAAYRTHWRDPLVAGYRNLEINAIPGLSGGPTFLMPRRLAAYDLSAEISLADAALAYATAIRDAYEMRLTTLGHAATPEAGCTVHLSVVDSSGTMVSLTNTLLSRFGSKVVLPEAGILMNNGIMWFDPRPHQPNSINGRRKAARQHVPADPEEGRPPGTRHRRRRRANDLSHSSSDHLLHGRLRSFAGRGVSRAAHRRQHADDPASIAKRRSGRCCDASARGIPVEIVEDTLYPVNFAIPSAVMRAGTENVGMAHPTSPWAAVAIGSAADDD